MTLKMFFMASEVYFKVLKEDFIRSIHMRLSLSVSEKRLWTQGLMYI